MKLWVVMPVYNEEESIGRVVREWSQALSQACPGFVFCVLNDGSTDGTPGILQKLQAEVPNLLVIEKENTGHGQTCVEGYRRALEGGAEWVLQIDSDGQCDPRFFRELLAAAQAHPIVYGHRRTRDDGRKRLIVSRLVSVVTFLATGVRVRDPNTPYRLMRSDTLLFLGEVPGDFHLANILVAVLQQKRHGIRWLAIHFRRRHGGASHAGCLHFMRRGLELFRQLRRCATAPASGAPAPMASGALRCALDTRTV